MVDLPRSARPDDRQARAWRDGQVEPVDHERLVGRVAEAEAVDLDARGGRGRWKSSRSQVGRCRIGYLGPRIGQLEEALGGRLVRIPRPERLGERPDDLEAGQRDQRKGGEEDRVETPGLDEADADCQNGDPSQARQHR